MSNKTTAHAPARRLLGWASGLFVLAIVCIAFWPRRYLPPGEPVSPADGDPRLTWDTPYLNVRPGVKYVGDAACAGCHAEHARTYRQHPMGRSFARVDQVSDGERFDSAAGQIIDVQGFQLLAQRKGDTFFHKQIHRDEQDVTAETEQEVHFVLGSGRHGHTYLVERDGYLYQSPISWFSKQGGWGVAPGSYTGHFGFRRPVTAQCVYCHTNDAAHVPHSINQYQQPIFHQHAIGCERCHGPGELHVKQRGEQGEVTGPDNTIVNPARLEPALREAVCQQCHLVGAQRVERRGRQLTDYRPGLPLHLFITTFVLARNPPRQDSSTSHVEQMYDSRCFRASQGPKQLGCISCHNPHELPAPETRVAFYRQRCLNCHAEKPCALPVAVRQEKNREDSCIACHMPAKASGDIAHEAVTDHRIARRQGEGLPPEPESSPPNTFLRSFHGHLPGVPPEELARDHAVAASTWENSSRSLLVFEILRPLEKTLAADPDDVRAWEAKAVVLWSLKRPREALEALDAALQRAPKREQALEYATRWRIELGQHDDALTYAKRWQAANPWQIDARVSLAWIYLKRRDLSQAEAACQAALAIEPTYPGPRLPLIQCYLQGGQRDKARTEFEKLLKLDPKNAGQLRVLFAGKL